MESLRLIDKIMYRPPLNRPSNRKTSLPIIGLDSEADTDGRTFIWCDSEGGVWEPTDLPDCLFTQRLRGQNAVVWNLRYEATALIKLLPLDCQRYLRTTGNTIQGVYHWTIIGDKCLSIRRGKNTFHIYDLFGFYLASLNRAAQKYLNATKIEQDVTLYTTTYIQQNWHSIVEYCRQDAVLTRDLGLHLLRAFEAFGVYPGKLYSTAHVSWTYFRSKCVYVHVKRYWDNYPEVLRYALAAYNGGKFEVTRKGPGTYYEYDIVSAYPATIAKLIDIRKAEVSWTKRYLKNATYSYLECIVKIPFSVHSPLPHKIGQLCTYPCGELWRVLTKSEYEYMRKAGCDITILSAVHLHTDDISYPYRDAIEELVRLKQSYKSDKDGLLYHTVKILLNSLYGKFCQLTPKDGKLKAGAAWNPVYASEITSQTRLEITAMQQKFPQVVAVHTDSVIATEPLPIETGDQLGQWEASASGPGLILGSGVYQIGNKSRLRGFKTPKPLLDLLPEKGDKCLISRVAPRGWREILHRKLPVEEMNRFVLQEKHLRVAFDRKRLWLEDWRNYSEVRQRTVESLPLVNLDWRPTRYDF